MHALQGRSQIAIERFKREEILVFPIDFTALFLLSIVIFTGRGD